MKEIGEENLFKCDRKPWGKRSTLILAALYWGYKTIFLRNSVRNLVWRVCGWWRVLFVLGNGRSAAATPSRTSVSHPILYLASCDITRIYRFGTVIKTIGDRNLHQETGRAWIRVYSKSATTFDSMSLPSISLPIRPHWNTRKGWATSVGTWQHAQGCAYSQFNQFMSLFLSFEEEKTARVTKKKIYKI